MVIFELYNILAQAYFISKNAIFVLVYVFQWSYYVSFTDLVGKANV